jgi:4-amino-4-deoxy-L-arabinose transferase-like glycosyltransferase
MADPIPSQAAKASKASILNGVKRAWVGLDNKLAYLYEMLIAEHPRALLAVLTLIWLFPGIIHFPFVDRDEPRFAYAAQEMIDRDSPIVPTFAGEYRFDKPPFIYWCMQLSYKLFDYNNTFLGNQFSARLPTLLSAVVVVLLIWGLGTRLYNREVGFWSALAFLTCVQVFMHGRLCVADMPMMIFIISGCWALWELLQKPSWKWALCFWVSMSLGFSTKWVVPWAVAGVTWFLYYCFKRSWPKLGNLKPISGFVLMTAIILLWAVPAWQQTHGEFFRVGIGQHVLQRGTTSFNARPYNPLNYLGTAFFSLMPWLAFLGGVVGFLRSNFDDRAKFLCAWVLGTYVMFSVMKTQLPHYVMPAFPALLIMIVAATGLHRPVGLWARRFYYFCFGLWGIVLLLAAIVVIILPLPDYPIQLVKIAGLFLIVSMGSLVALSWAKSHNKHLMMLVMFLLVPLLFGCGTLLVSHCTPAQQVAALLRQEELPPETLVSCDYDEPSLIAYTQSTWLNEPDYHKAKAAYEKAQSAALLVLSEEYTLGNIPQVLMNQPLKAHKDNMRLILEDPPQGGRRVSMEGVNFGRFSWVSYDLYLKP